MPHSLPPVRSSLAVVLGTNEIASAVAVFLRRSGRAVVLSHDPLVPVMRRGMAFHDALFNEVHEVEGIMAKRVERLSAVVETAAENNQVAITPLGLTDLLVLGGINILVDARMHKRETVPDFRGLARVTIGLGPGFVGRGNCDVAIETVPGREGIILSAAGTAPQQPMSRQLGDAGSERFVYAPSPGRWRTPLDIGAKVFKGVIVGQLDGIKIHAPIDGVLRGLVRDGTELPAGVKLLEIDPRGRNASWLGIDEPCRRIAEAVLCAVILCDADAAIPNLHRGLARAHGPA
jgi:xanthine dehydrogenase accessory factor